LKKEEKCNLFASRASDGAKVSEREMVVQLLTVLRGTGRQLVVCLVYCSES
jgi:hypothetical protein